jgi:N-carbamoylputrescine amidase
LRIACVQMEPRIGEKAANVARSVAFIEEAARQGAELVVLPELANTGYVFESLEEATGLSEPVPDGETTRIWSEVAARRGLHIVAGISERAGDKLYNSAVLVGPAGYIGTYRKMHLWGDEKKVFAHGDLGFPVYGTALGRLGIGVCYDGWFPEMYRLQALEGAQIICVPTNWVPMPGQTDEYAAMANTLTMAAAHSNGLIIACADRIGIERGQPFEGQSLIVDRTGWPLARAGKTEETIIYADVTLGGGQGKVGADNNVLADRRTDVYAEMLGFSASAKTD